MIRMTKISKKFVTIIFTNDVLVCFLIKKDIEKFLTLSYMAVCKTVFNSF
jgi:hypothetical protein